MRSEGRVLPMAPPSFSLFVVSSPFSFYYKTRKFTQDQTDGKWKDVSCVSKQSWSHLYAYRIIPIRL